MEGNDFNLNGVPDDNVTLTGLDTDGDGLDNRFDANNPGAEATSAYMGNGGSTTGDPTPGSNTMVQRTVMPYGCPAERDWRCMLYVLDCHITSFTAHLQSNNVKLNWTVFCKKEVSRFVVERSIDGTGFTQVATVAGRPVVNESEMYQANDNVVTLSPDVVYYRLKTEEKNGWIVYSAVVKVTLEKNDLLSISPNPVMEDFSLYFGSTVSGTAVIHIRDIQGRDIYTTSQHVIKGYNRLNIKSWPVLPAGTYFIAVQTGKDVLYGRFVKL